MLYYPELFRGAWNDLAASASESVEAADNIRACSSASFPGQSEYLPVLHSRPPGHCGLEKCAEVEALLVAPDLPATKFPKSGMPGQTRAAPVSPPRRWQTVSAASAELQVSLGVPSWYTESPEEPTQRVLALCSTIGILHGVGAQDRICRAYWRGRSDVVTVLRFQGAASSEMAGRGCRGRDGRHGVPVSGRFHAILSCHCKGPSHLPSKGGTLPGFAGVSRFQPGRQRVDLRGQLCQQKLAVWPRGPGLSVWGWIPRNCSLGGDKARVSLVVIQKNMTVSCLVSVRR
ncbi:unnamed protein product [Polarella glacialis]|uniref:Uncharacterized protein n=1 Tax=Polarella glacialis TaxID=89957 RepID=A0A813IWZ3_POLGL|nr:unnamed protein product [Polarella glacialis]CAE8656821.1 unnamed protein product [Polarella glacialis]